MTSRVPGRSAPILSADERLGRVLAYVMAGLLLTFLAWPLAEILVKAVQGHEGQFIGLRNLREVLTEPRLRDAAWNSVFIATTATALVVPAALGFAYALCQSRIRPKSLFKVIALSPLLTPSLMPAISLVYLFGHQGLLQGWLHGHSIYGPLGIILGESFYTFPYALLVLATALGMADARLYEAAEVLGANRFRRFLTVTMPNIRYGLISACLIVFTLIITDFGVPIVVGGQTNVLALEAYKQVLGQQNFQKGAAVGLILLLPAVLSFAAERWLARGRGGRFSGSSVAYSPKPGPVRDGLLWGLCAAISVFLLAMTATAVAASFIKLWPYKMNFTLAHYDFANMDGGGWLAFQNSLKLGALTAAVGCAVVFAGAYLVEKTPAPRPVAALIQSLALTPMAVPGLVLGLGYVFFFNLSGNPLHVFYGTMTLLVVCTIAHYLTTAQMTATTALRQLDAEFEAAALSLKAPLYRHYLRVTVPICLPALLDIVRYLFVSAMTTVSAAIFLYSPDTILAAVAVLNMDDAGNVGGAAAMSTLILFTSASVSLLLAWASRGALRRSQAWRQTAPGQ